MAMTAPRVPDSRFRAYVQFVVALFYYFLARALAHHGALGLSSAEWSPLVEQAMLVFLLLLGYAGVGFSLNGQAHPVSAQGLPRRPGWVREAGLGLVIGWSVTVVCAAVVAIGGGIAIRLSFSLRAWGWFLAEIAFFALLALGEEMRSNALRARWGRRERCWALRRCMRSCKRWSRVPAARAWRWRWC